MKNTVSKECNSVLRILPSSGLLRELHSTDSRDQLQNYFLDMSTGSNYNNIKSNFGEKQFGAKAF